MRYPHFLEKKKTLRDFGEGFLHQKIQFKPAFSSFNLTKLLEERQKYDKSPFSTRKWKREGERERERERVSVRNRILKLYKRGWSVLKISVPNRHISKMISRCVSCGYTFTHTDHLETLGDYPSFVETHYTCVCMLFEKSVVCCVRGYSNLLSNVPVLSLYTNTPLQNYEQWKCWSTLGTPPHTNQISSFVKSCADVKKLTYKSYLNSFQL